LLAVALPQQTGGTIGAFDTDVATAESLGKFGTKELLQPRHTHFRNCHVLSPALASRHLLH
jgi:hypothetical protein